eukprot:GHUV01047926.1.p2 GENE.GHUV01047926.1~~GHUV01047926.1.p2  ORF type:complete len:111 (+),score=19.87 GHUV01047926.1:165-497(+)
MPRCLSDDHSLPRQQQVPGPYPAECPGIETATATAAGGADGLRVWSHCRIPKSDRSGPVIPDVTFAAYKGQLVWSMRQTLRVQPTAEMTRMLQAVSLLCKAQSAANLNAR